MTADADVGSRPGGGCFRHDEARLPAPPPVEQSGAPPDDAREQRRAATPAPARGRVLSITPSGATGVALPLAPGERQVAPSDGADRNTSRESLRAVGCWTASIAHVEFDSSLILPEIADEIPRLQEVRAANPGGPATVFAHADPVGNDAYNKQLSGRRAVALFGLLTRRVELWDRLFANPFGGDDWRPRGLAMMRQHLESSGQPGATVPTERRALFLAYMSAICRDRAGAEVRFAATDFLAGGADPGGKGDVQGCGEFNPVLMLSAAETARLARPENKAERDVEQDPNRRVLVLFFTPGSVVAPEKWPCPRATEGVTGCRRRFFSDADARRTPQASRREHPADRSTFACRFYDRLAGDSPCEVVSRPVTVRLYDPNGKPIPRAPFRLSSDGQTLMDAVADSGGFFRVRNFPSADGFLIEWGPTVPAGGKPTFPFADVIHLNLSTSPSTRVAQQLVNLGYSGEASIENKVKAFQRDFQDRFRLPVTGILDPATEAAIDDAHSRVAVEDLRSKGDA
ncbi:MAG: peptidoglycan-binding protein [Gemmatimonadales bacterium]